MPKIEVYNIVNGNYLFPGLSYTIVLTEGEYPPGIATENSIQETVKAKGMNMLTSYRDHWRTVATEKTFKNYDSESSPWKFSKSFFWDAMR